MTLFFSAAMLLLIVRLAKGEEKNMMFARVFSLASNVGFWIGIVRIAVLNRSGFLMFFYITGAMLSYTAMVFACNLGAVTSLVAVPQAAVFFALFFAAKAIYPLTTPTMIGDFKACGGFLLIATGCRIAKMQDFPVADMIPTMVLVMPLSALWTNYIAPLL